jgi:hypothetical protein
MSERQNAWISREERLASWEACFDPRTDPGRLLTWLALVLAAGERESIYRVLRCAARGYDRDRQGEPLAVLRQGFEASGTLHLLDFESDGAAPGDRIDTRVAYWDVHGRAVEERVADLGAILSRAFPERLYTSYMASRPPFCIEGSRLETRDPTSPWQFDRRPSLAIRFYTHSDIWFPLVQGLLVRDTPYDPPRDNRELAGRHTPRLNRFVAEVREATLEAGGQWRIDEDFCDSFLLYGIRETGIDLSAIPAEPIRPPRSNRWADTD